MSKNGHSTKTKRTNDQLVLRVLRRANGPLTAYQILDRLREDGISGPPTVYRALDKLLEKGLAHRIETLNAYVRCRERKHCTPPAFAICDGCGTVAEFSDAMMQTRLQEITEQMGFGVRAGSIEMRGRCSGCRSNDEKREAVR
ncbi:Fur family transcriptional regulator [Nisaea sp.]|uniref:Fur family transcriptional regulator n=1 Tax=Nisaea sp. TaxID=2024842 RepID=UPI003296D8DA